MATTKEYDLGEFTFPRGWFMVADSATVTREPRSIHFFGQDLALYRGESGRVVLLDAYCPHMRTNIACETTSFTALDGRVEGDCIRCPYHGWRFGADGKCNEIPYSTQPIPRAAKLRAWPVAEALGAVFAWHDAEGGEPEWEAPALAEWDEAGWVRWVYDDLGTLNTHPQEIVDNIVDCSHLGPLHGQKPILFFENEFRGHLAIQRQGGSHRTLIGPGGKYPLLVTDTTYHGPGILVAKLTGMQDAIMFIAHTPTDDGVVHVWHAALVKAPSGAAQPTEHDVAAARAYQAAMLTAFSQDFGIWGNKKPCLHGMYVSGDGPFQKERQWYRQFYNPRADREKYVKPVEGIHRVVDIPGAPECRPGETLGQAATRVNGG